MARTIEQIQAQIEQSVENDPVLSSDITSQSRRAHWRLWAYVVSVAQALLEQIIELVKSDIEALVDNAVSGSFEWVQKKMFEWQYDASDPQIIQLDTETMSYKYDVVDESLRLISRCSVSKGLYNSVRIKVAKSDTPEALSALELSAAQAYINRIGVAGVKYEVVSLPSDKLYVEADIYYNGLYSAVIEANVIAAINNYLSGIDFNGRMINTDLEIAIKSVTGVNDVVIKNLGARTDGTAFANRTLLVSNKTEIFRDWQTIAGYMVGETTTGNTLADKLTFISE